MRKIVIALSVLTLLTSCVSKKKYTDLEAKNKETQDLLNTATVKLNSCLEEKAGLAATVEGLKEKNQLLINTSKDMTVLTTKGAENIEKALETIKEKDLKISRMQDALTKKDSVTLALVTSLKSSVGISDPDIEINVEKGVVFISIADKLLFKSGSYEVTDKAKAVLAKVAKVVNDKPDFECMVEGHTDNVGKADFNQKLSDGRANAVKQYLIDNGIDPFRLTSKGFGMDKPIDSNKTAKGKANNRRVEVLLVK